MKEEELLLLKEELVRIKEDKHCLWGFGVLIFIWGVFAAFTSLDIGNFGLAMVWLIIFTVVAIICVVVAELKYERDYQDKLKELKKGEKGD